MNTKKNNIWRGRSKTTLRVLLLKLLRRNDEAIKEMEGNDRAENRENDNTNNQ